MDAECPDELDLQTAGSSLRLNDNGAVGFYRGAAILDFRLRPVDIKNDLIVVVVKGILELVGIYPWERVTQLWPSVAPTLVEQFLVIMDKL